MNLQAVLKQVKEKIQPDKQTLANLKSVTDVFVGELKRQLAAARVKGDVFIGGSYAKNTLVRKDEYDVDVLVRLEKEGDLSGIIGASVEKTAVKLKMACEKTHGSRDYFRIKKENVVFEVIPVSKINKPSEERNVTDLTYFHVPYVKRQGEGLEGDIRLAKAFCAAQGVYGAESYIQGFSGYALECLIINYGSFTSMLKALVKIDVTKGKLIIDQAKHYKNKQEVLVRINEAKLKSPIILIDPTYKERNALAALSEESFIKFQKSAKEFLVKPGARFFEENENDFEDLTRLANKKKAEFVRVVLTTDRQAGDIAGTKLKKFSVYLERELAEYFDIYRTVFNYEGSDEAEFYIVAQTKKSYTKIGPPIKMVKAVQAFKKVNKKVIVKGGKLIAIVPINFDLRRYLSDLSKEKDKLAEMAITSLEVN